MYGRIPITAITGDAARQQRALAVARGDESRERRDARELRRLRIILRSTNHHSRIISVGPM
jgi:hypothetical protein